MRDRNGREFVMSGVEMTVPFVLKFVGFSGRGNRYVTKLRYSFAPGPLPGEEMSFPRGRQGDAGGSVESGWEPACVRNIIIMRDNNRGLPSIPQKRLSSPSCLRHSSCAPKIPTSMSDCRI